MRREKRHAARRDIRLGRLYGRVQPAMRISAGGGKVSQTGRREADRLLGPGGGFRDDCFNGMIAGFSPWEKSRERFLMRGHRIAGRDLNGFPKCHQRPVHFPPWHAIQLQIERYFHVAESLKERDVAVKV